MRNTQSLLKVMQHFIVLVGVIVLFVQCGGDSDDEGSTGSAAITGDVRVMSYRTNGEGNTEGETLLYMEATGIKVELCEFVDYGNLICGIDTTSTKDGAYHFSPQDAGVYSVMANINDLISAEADSMIYIDDQSKINGPTIRFGPYARHRGMFLEANRLPFPNPFTREITLLIEVKDPAGTNLEGDLTVRLYNVKGVEVSTLLNEKSTLPGARTPIVWDGSDTNGNPVSAGMYFYVVTWYNPTTNDFERYIGNIMKR